MGLVRLNLNIDYDPLHDMSNNHDGMRVLMGIQTRGVFERGKEYNLQTIKDNVGLLDEATLIKINEVVVKAGHEIKKKEAALGCDQTPLVGFKH